MVDADDGYGGVLSVARTVEELERAGVAGLNLEDQRFPKRCGHLAGKECLPVAESVAKIRAALDARSDPSFVIVARTDAVSGGKGLDDAIDRAKRYAGEGADLVWCEFSTPDRSVAERFAQELRRAFPDLPLLFNYSSSFDWPKEPNPLSFAELADLGYRVVLVGLGALHAGMAATWNSMADLRERGHEAAIDLQRGVAGHPAADHHAMGDAQRYLALELAYRNHEQR